MSGLRIVVLIHEADGFSAPVYLLPELCLRWQAAGHRVTIVRGAGDPLPAADLVILHVDLTVVPDDYMARVADHPNVVNGTVRDISKRIFSDLIVSSPDAWPGPVIVKTDANYGGRKEWRLAQLNGTAVGNTAVRRPWRRVEFLSEYPVFATPRDVPFGVWRNAKLNVEKLISERDAAGHYCLRKWLFFGDREVCFTCFSPDVVVKGENTVRREYTETVPDELREIRTRLAIDFGKFDYAMVDGKPVLYDINSTPGFRLDSQCLPAAKDNVATLADGLDSLIGRHLTKRVAEAV